ncbi:MAG: shikimate kinase [Elainella sp. Prado103]|nr:shikimate kinase [Elainella sp. Prado103]
MAILRDRLQGTNLYLIGMMGAGKSTIGQQIAKQLDYRFFDTDQVIEQATGQAIRDLFAGMGEMEFRRLETQVLSELAPYTRLVVATGGGIVSQSQNWSYLRHGLVIWLNVPIEVLYQRLQQDTTRPLLQTADPLAKLQLLLQERRSLYAQADLEIPIEASDTTEQVVDRVLSQIPTILKPMPEQIPSNLDF